MIYRKKRKKEKGKLGGREEGTKEEGGRTEEAEILGLLS